MSKNAEFKSGRHGQSRKLSLVRLQLVGDWFVDIENNVCFFIFSWDFSCYHYQLRTIPSIIIKLNCNDVKLGDLDIMPILSQVTTMHYPGREEKLTQNSASALYSTMCAKSSKCN